MVEVFKTDVQNNMQACLITDLLKSCFTDAKINFDLDDCDKILRIEGINASLSIDIINDVRKLGFHCEVLN